MSAVPPNPPTPNDQEQIDLQRRVEEASLNAWPATHQLLLDGWLIRLSNGFTKRANCVVPLYPQRYPQQSTPHNTERSTLDKIRYCENLYAREQLQTVFRLTSESHCEPLDNQLAGRGYARVDETDVQLLDLKTHTPPSADTKPLAEQPLPGQPELRLVNPPQWLDAYAKLAKMPANAYESHAKLIRSIRPECAFALLEINNTPVACALGVLEHNLLGLFDVITAEAHRGKGLAGELLGGLLSWGVQHGARHAYLQVIESNRAARALYGRLGFQPVYRYWYRISG